MCRILLQRINRATVTFRFSESNKCLSLSHTRSTAEPIQAVVMRHVALNVNTAVEPIDASHRSTQHHRVPPLPAAIERAP